jgi:hypothetical protein
MRTHHHALTIRSIAVQDQPYCLDLTSPAIGERRRCTFRARQVCLAPCSPSPLGRRAEDEGDLRAKQSVV